MAKEKNQNFEDHHHHQRWDIMKDEDEHEQHPCSSIEEASTISNLSSSSSSLTCCSSSSSDTADDASSANSSRSSLYDLSDLMSHLPIKRGLSKFYHGKSDSFTSLARVTSIEDLPKNKNTKKKKSLRSFTLPKPIISKKKTRKKKFNKGVNSMFLITVVENFGVNI